MVNENFAVSQPASEISDASSNISSVSLFENHACAFQPRVQLWLTNSADEGFGHGRMELFRLIGNMGSLSKAARTLGMSYRAAWGKIKAMERAIGVRLVCSQGAKRDGYALTPEALALMDAFERWFADVQTYAAERAQNYFPASVPEQAVCAGQSQDTQNAQENAGFDAAGQGGHELENVSESTCFPHEETPA